MKKAVLLLVCLVIFVPLTWILIHRYEGSPPEVTVHLPSQYLKKSYVMDLQVHDKQSGLRQVEVVLVQKNNEKVLMEKTYPAGDLFSLFANDVTHEDSFSIPIETRTYGMSDGEADIKILVRDNAWRGWNRGNVFQQEKKVIIDTQAPKVRILTRHHNISRGGSALVIYRVFEPDIQSGVLVGDDFFPGYSGMFKDPNVIAAFFALDHTRGPGTRITIQARDLAGNVTERGFHHYIRDVSFRTDVLGISDEFLERKMPDIDTADKAPSFEAAANPLLAKFLYVNGELRKKNTDLILSIPSDTEGQLFWTGRFDRMAGAATRAKFADRRIYKHHGKEIDRATHLGIDLASVSNADVKAANAGRVIMTQNVGIYGNSVIIDHGFGLASLYSHLSEIYVNKGDMLKQGDVIGKSGLTGLAGGDHLHFGMIMHNVFVNPVEWWDASWIKNNITSKIDAVKREIGAEGN